VIENAKSRGFTSIVFAIEVLYHQEVNAKSMKNDVKVHFEKIAPSYDSYKRKNWYYYKSVKNILARFVPQNKTVLELGCGTGDILAHLNPYKGVGVDISPKMVALARRKHRGTNMKFIASDITTLRLTAHFDFIIMVDVVEHLGDVKKSFAAIARHMDKNTTLFSSMINPLWEPVFLAAEKLGLKMPEGPHRRIPFSLINTYLTDLGITVIRHDYQVLCPVYIPILTDVLNSFVEPLLKPLCCIEYILANK